MLREQGEDEDDLDDAVDEQVPGAEQQAGSAQPAGGVQQPGGDGVAGVFGQLMLGESGDDGVDVGGADQQQQDAADDLQQAVQAFEHDADLEDPVEPVFRLEPDQVVGEGWTSCRVVFPGR